MNIRILLVALFVFFLSATVPAVAADQSQLDALIVGTHPLTLQWLDNFGRGNRGSMTVVRKDNELVARGYQEEQYQGERNWLRLSGIIRVMNERELELDGTISTRISYINDGIEHERKGRFHFKAWGKRPYWRMQNNRTQPDKGFEVTDYIDIYFR